MKNLLIVLLCIAFFSLSAQEKKYKELSPDIEWSEGSILLNNGKELKGLIRFNDRLGVLAYENGDASGSYTSRSVTAFEFFDASLNTRRLFYSIELTDPQTNVKRPFFFEALKDYKNFSVVSKIDPVEIRDKTESLIFGSPSESWNQDTGTEIKQRETIYFFSPDGKLEPYIQLTRKVVDRKLYDREKTKRKIINDDLIAKYFKEPGRSKMLQFARDNSLEFDIKEDLLKILNSYEE